MKFTNPLRALGPMLPLQLENQLFTIAGNFIEGYRGGLWTSMQVGNDYIAIPPVKGEVRVQNHMNYSDVTVDPKTAGAIVSLMALGRLAEHYYFQERFDLSDPLVKMSQRIKDAVLAKNSGFDHSAIYAVLD